MIGPPLLKLSIRKFELKRPPVAAGAEEAAGAALAAVIGEVAVVAAGDMPGATAGDIPGASAGDMAGVPMGEIPGAVAAGLIPRAGLVAGVNCGGTAGDAGGDMAGDGCARLESASVKEQKQTVSSVFIFRDGLEDRLDAVTGSFCLVMASQPVASRGKT
ncbi:MAG: hypothetical protein ABJB22_03055 [Verrucomicrobiota bacterium]